MADGSDQFPPRREGQPERAPLDGPSLVLRITFPVLYGSIMTDHVFYTWNRTSALPAFCAFEGRNRSVLADNLFLTDIDKYAVLTLPHLKASSIRRSLLKLHGVSYLSTYTYCLSVCRVCPCSRSKLSRSDYPCNRPQMTFAPADRTDSYYIMWPKVHRVIMDGCDESGEVLPGNVRFRTLGVKIGLMESSDRTSD